VRRQATFTVADVDADGFGDVCGRPAGGWECHRFDGITFVPTAPLTDLSDAAGWGVYSRWSTLRLGDVDDDGDLDLCGDASCWPWVGDGFGAAFAGPSLPTDPAHRATLRVADVTADGRADLCARDATGFWCWASTGTGFGPAVAGPAWSDAAGWTDPAWAATIRAAGQWEPAPPPPTTGGTPPGSDPPTAPGSPDDEPGPGWGREPIGAGSGCGCGTGLGRGWWVVGLIVTTWRGRPRTAAPTGRRPR
jgi:hypothetical protein